MVGFCTVGAAEAVAGIANMVTATVAVATAPARARAHRPRDLVVASSPIAYPFRAEPLDSIRITYNAAEASDADRSCHKNL
jgi:hypothetical protein